MIVNIIKKIINLPIMLFLSNYNLITMKITQHIKYTIILITFILLGGCGGDGGGSSSSTIFISANSLSLGAPDSNAQSVAFYNPNKINKEKQFANNSYFGIISAHAAELVESLLGGISEPVLQTFSEVTLDVLEADYINELALYQGSTNGFSYNSLLQTGQSSGTYISAGDLVYGFLWSLWLDEKSLRQDVYQNIPNTILNTTDEHIYTRTYGNNEYFIGWLENPGSITIRSVYTQNDSDINIQKAINATIGTNSIQINSVQSVIFNGGASRTIFLSALRTSSNAIQIAGRIFNSQWSVDVKNSSATNSDEYITFKANIIRSNSESEFRVDYAQCPTSSCELTSTDASTGTISYNIDSNNALTEKTTTTLDIATIAIPDIANFPNTATASPSFFAFDLRDFSQPE